MPNPSYSFTPGLANRFRSAANGQPGQFGNNASQALQVLSLHLPQTLQGTSMPDSLLRGSGGLTPDVAVRAQTSGLGPAINPLTLPSAASPSLSPSPLSIATPQMTALTSAAIAPPQMYQASDGLSGSAASPFAAAPTDSGPESSSRPPSPAFQFQGPEQSAQNVGGDFAGLSALMERIFGGGGGGQDYQSIVD